ncbi:ABC transporter substrate-binding protein [Roseomonas sp. PWR1]|uniref:ABC transporter substrate-binding protein n=1 Tax=Roseomonas nitratireducens TaxID=2820810 RepID=A0ABS4AQ42_9PROT|nr:ABC transporter substrate-binding protein [Neoroseomonas nitratireducens]MBP0463486.1 ABC transporter substrate-binding protein [Neoroseomonas nitratireducens]
MIGRRAALALPLAAAARDADAQPRRPRRIGYVHSVSIGPANNATRIIGGHLRQRGFVDAQTLFLRAGRGDPAVLERAIEELLAHDPGALIAVGAPAVFAAARLGRGVPVVAVDLETDPVAAGLAASDARPGGHVTGLFLDQPSLAGKWLDLLLELAPATRHVVFLWDPATGPHQRDVAVVQAGRRRLTAAVVNPFDTDALPSALARAARGTVGVVMLTAPGITEHLGRIGGMLQAMGVPGVTFLANFVGSGFAMGYGVDQPHYFARAAVLAERILDGEDPGAIPIERPTRFRFAIDLRATGTLGLAVPHTLLALADEVLE